MLPIRYERHLLTNTPLPFIYDTKTIELSKSAFSTWHDNIEFLCCIQGEGTVHSGSDDIHMKCGDTVIINPRCLHYITCKKSATYRCLIIDNSFLKRNGFDISHIRFQTTFTDSKASEFMEEIVTAFDSTDSTFRIAEIRLCVLNYILYICKNYTRYNEIGEGGKISKGHEAILKAFEFIDENYQKRLSIDEISAIAGFSKFHFSRLFKNYTGFTLIDHINSRRCENAKILLEDETKTISQIASDCGFESSSYFAKAFEKNFGILPSAYRKSLK